jgi:hypothetical protein
VTNGARVRLRHHALTRDDRYLLAVGLTPYRNRRTGCRHRMPLSIGNFRDAAVLSAHPFPLASRGRIGNGTSRQWTGSARGRDNKLVSQRKSLAAVRSIMEAVQPRTACNRPI